MSSTGHLLLFQDLLGFQPQGDVFPVVIQFGAILSVVVVYWSKFWRTLVDLSRPIRARGNSLHGVLIAFIPGGHRRRARCTISSSACCSIRMVIAIALIVGGIAILIVERIAPRRAIATAIICRCDVPSDRPVPVPGADPRRVAFGRDDHGRRLLGVERKAAAEFTFYLAVPTMFGAFVFDLYKNWSHLSGSDGMLIADRLCGVVPRRLRRGEDVHRLYLRATGSRRSAGTASRSGW